MSSGLKYDGGKARWDLMPLRALDEVARVLTFGANKYVKEIDMDANSMICYLKQELEVIAWTVNTKKSTAEECVEIATKSGSKKEIQSMQSASGKTTETGSCETNLGSETTSRIGRKTPYAGREISEQSDSESLGSADCQRKQQHYFLNNKEIDVVSVKDHFLCVRSIWTMTMQQGLQEVIYVVGATTDLECLASLYTILKKQYNISEDTQLKVSSEKLTLVVVGDNNWQKVDGGRRKYFAAAMRHMRDIEDLMGKKDYTLKDMESGLLHLAHAAACILFVIHFVLTGTGKGK